MCARTTSTWPLTPGCAAPSRCRPSWNWNGVRSRSLRGYGQRTQTSRPACVPRDDHQALYPGGKGVLARELAGRLRTGRPLRKRRRRADWRAIRFIAEARLITERPEIVAVTVLFNPGDPVHRRRAAELRLSRTRPLLLPRYAGPGQRFLPRRRPRRPPRRRRQAVLPLQTR